ncbi:MAG: hypothetical protein WKF75_05090 [Singulisphaera sp.]
MTIRPIDAATKRRRPVSITPGWAIAEFPTGEVRGHHPPRSGGRYDPSSRFFAEENGEPVGYALFNPSGRISYPWCLPEATQSRVPLLEAVLSAMRERGLAEAWAAYRADWEPVLVFFHQHGFLPTRLMINYVAELSRLPRAAAPGGSWPPWNGGNWRRSGRWERGSSPKKLRDLEFYWDNRISRESLFVVKGKRTAISGSRR